MKKTYPAISRASPREWSERNRLQAEEAEFFVYAPEAESITSQFSMMHAAKYKKKEPLRYSSC